MRSDTVAFIPKPVLAMNMFASKDKNRPVLAHIQVILRSTGPSTAHVTDGHRLLSVDFNQPDGGNIKGVSAMVDITVLIPAEVAKAMVKVKNCEWFELSRQQVDGGDNPLYRYTLHAPQFSHEFLENPDLTFPDVTQVTPNPLQVEDSFGIVGLNLKYLGEFGKWISQVQLSRDTAPGATMIHGAEKNGLEPTVWAVNVGTMQPEILSANYVLMPMCP